MQGRGGAGRKSILARKYNLINSQLICSSICFVSYIQWAARAGESPTMEASTMAVAFDFMLDLPCSGLREFLQGGFQVLPDFIGCIVKDLRSQ